MPIKTLELINACAWNIGAQTKTMAHMRAEVNQRLSQQILNQEIANEIAHTNLMVAHASYRELGEIHNSIDRLVSSSDATRKAVEDGFGKVAGAIREQTALHKAHYDRLQRADELRELLYRMNRFREHMEEQENAFIRAVGARNMLRLIESKCFGTRDMSSLEDKAAFDEFTTQTQRLADSLPPAQRDELDDLSTPMEHFSKSSAPMLRRACRE
jgi:hypothetical protein